MPVFWVSAEQRRQHHHLVFAGSDLGDGQDLVLGLRVADVQHRGGASLVLFQHAGRPVSHLQRVVGRELTFDILRGHLDRQEKKRKLRRLSC